MRGISALLHEPPFHHARTGFAHGSGDVVEKCRERLARLFNAPDASRIAFSSGATESLNLAIRGLPLDGRHVITTAMEHNSVLRPLKTLERAGRIRLTIVDCDCCGAVSSDSIREAITPHTSAVIVNHCSNVTGMVNDINAIGALTSHLQIPFVVDASQSAGVYPIDVQEAHIDVLAFAGHKSLYGIQGIGGAYIAEGIALEPLIVGGTGVRSDYLYQPETMPMHYEAGTQNLPGIRSLYDGVGCIMDTGLASIRRRKQELVQRMRQSLSRHGAVSLYPADSCACRTTLVSLTIAGIDPSDIGYILANDFGIVVRSGLHCAPLIHRRIGTWPEGSVRVSPSHYTTDDDVDAFCRAIDQIVQMAE